MNTPRHRLPIWCHLILRHRHAAPSSKVMSVPVLVATCWMPLGVLVLISFATRPLVPTWAFMWAMVLSLVVGCKWITWCCAIRSHSRVKLWKSLCYLLAWPGMDAPGFLYGTREADGPRPGEWFAAATKLAMGVIFIWIVPRCVPASHQVMAGWVGMIGLAFLLHFGILHLLSLGYRSIGIQAPRIFVDPLLAHSVSNFWGARWNLAFRDLAHHFVFRPLSGRFGTLISSLAAFVFSGLAHELVISLPAAAGYGLPTGYFLLQWLGLIVEKSSYGRRLGLNRAWTGRLFAALIVVGPIGILFHVPFVNRVIVPFLVTTNAL